ncbi:MAG: HEAT repeat domain-containing protein [Planctomycetes bacterium]|nr:HEAT repeat domain-containing protein [Planctomycetota bacterium]
MRTTALVVLATLIANTAPTEAGVEVKKSREGMTYSIRIPAGYIHQQGARLVFAMHGRGDVHTRFMSVVQGASYLNNTILIAPNAPTNAQWALADLPVIAALVDEIKARYHVTRTIFFGFSMGAYCSFSMGLRYPDKIQAVIPHSGGIPMQVPSKGIEDQVFYVIHGDADAVVPVSQSQTAVERLKQSGVKRLHYREIPGLGHSMHPQASQDAFKWVETTLGPAAAPLGNAEASKAIAALGDALKGKDWTAATELFESVKGAPLQRRRAIAGLVKKALKADVSKLSLAAIAAAGELGAAGLGPLKSVSKKDDVLSAAAAQALAKTHSPKAFKLLLGHLKGKSEDVAVAAAEGLGAHGGLPAIPLLIRGLKSAGGEEKSQRRAALLAALKRITGKSFESAKDWSRWFAKSSR